MVDLVDKLFHVSSIDNQFDTVTQGNIAEDLRESNDKKRVTTSPSPMIGLSK